MNYKLLNYFFVIEMKMMESPRIVMEEDGVLLPTIKQELKRKMDITFAPLGAK